MPEDGVGKVAGGGCAVWGLPPDGTCAAVARSHVRAVMRALLVPEPLVSDAATMVSELATNVFVHALDGRPPPTMPLAGLPELYMYRRGNEPELVIKVYDSAPWRGAFPSEPLRPGWGAESGRGFEVVNALTAEHGGRWGVHRSRSWLGAAPLSGKVSYFTLPVPWSQGVQAPVRDARQAARELEAVLATRGLGPLTRCEGWDMAVVSVRAEITVWARPRGIFLTTPCTGTVRHHLDEVTEVAEVIVRCNEDLDAR
ncbi:ATP-binding protein [Spirillospora sp. CA-253888]